MRPTILLLATAASCVFATKTENIEQVFQELVARTSCGEEMPILKCLFGDVDLGQLSAIEQCYIDGGCSKTDATVGAIWFAHQYQASKFADKGKELKRRAVESSSDAATTTEGKTSAKTTAKTSAKSASAKSADSSSADSSSAAASTTAPSSAAASTTTDSASASSTDSTTSNTASSTTSDSSTTSSTTSSSTTGTSTSTLVCSTTNTITTSVCSVSNGKTISCMPTTSLIATCAAGVLCQTNPKGEDVCMKIDNHVTPGGIAVAVVFGTALVGAAFGIMFIQVQASRKLKRREMERDAFLAGYGGRGKGKSRATDVEASKGYAQVHGAESEADLPLINTPQQYPQRGGYFDQAGGVLGAAPKLHQGLGALGQDYNRR